MSYQTAAAILNQFEIFISYRRPEVTQAERSSHAMIEAQTGEFEMPKKQTSFAVLTLVLCVAVSSIRIARAETKPEDGVTRSIEVEYGRAGGLQVTFFDDLKPEVRAEFLRSQLENYVRLFKPATDYLATAYDSGGKNLGGQLIYVHDSQRITTVELHQQGR